MFRITTYKNLRNVFQFRFSNFIFKQEQKNQLLFFPNLPQMRQGSLLQINNSELALILAVLNQFSIALIFAQNTIAKDIKILPSSQLFIELSNRVTMNSIVTKQTDYPITSFKSYRPRTSSRKQLPTGNLYIDLFHPISYGQFIYFHNRDYLKKIASCFDQTIVLNGQKLNDSDILVQSDNDLAGDYLLPKVAANIASHNASLKRTLLVVENLTEHLRANQVIQQEIIQSMTQVVTPKQTLFTSPFLGDIAERCGFRQNDSNLTVAVIHDPELDGQDIIRSQLSAQLEQFASVIIPKKVKIMPPSSRNLSYQSRILYFVAQKMFTLLTEYEQQKNSYTMRQKLDIQIEPWDYYLYLDGKIWNEIIKEFNKTDNDYIDLVVVCWWIIKAVETETIAQIKDSGKWVLEDIKKFMKSFRGDNDQPLKEFFEEKIKEMGDSPQFQMFIVEHLNRFFELHVLNLRMADRLLAFKKDHFNN